MKQTMPTRGSLAVEVAKAHMEEQMKWSVQRIMKTCLCKGTAVYMVWTTDDHKSHPHTNFVGNVRIATWHSAGVGVTTFIFKDVRHQTPKLGGHAFDWWTVFSVSTHNL